MSTVFSQIGSVIGNKIKTLETNLTTNTDAITKLNANDVTFGSFAKGDADTLATSKLYTDNKESSLIAGYTNAVNNEVIARTNAVTQNGESTLSSAKSYTDVRETAITTAYTSADTLTLNASKSYTDGKEESLTTAYLTAISNNGTSTLASAKSYTDARETAITTAYMSAVSNEATSRTNAVSTLNTSISSEISRAQSAEITLTTAVNTKLNKSGGAVSGSLDMQNNAINNVPTPVANGDATNKSYVDSAVSAITYDQGLNTTNNVSFNNVTINGVLNSDDVTATTLTASGNVVIQGDLTVNGTTTTVNTEILNLADNIIVLNSNSTGTATQNAGIEVERGDDANVQLLWSETTNRWSVGLESFDASTFIGALTGNASTATTLQTARTISLSGDVSGSVSFNGSANAIITSTLANSGVTAGTYNSVTVDAKGRVTTGSNPTTLSGYGITDALSNTNPVLYNSYTLVDSAASTIHAALKTTDKIVSGFQGTAPGFSFISSSSGSALHRPVLKMVRSGGTLAAPTVPSSGDYVFSILGAVYDGTTTIGSAEIATILDGGVSTGIAPQKISFFTSPDATTRKERVSISSAGVTTFKPDGTNTVLTVNNTGVTLSGRTDLKTYTESKPAITYAATTTIDLSMGTCFDVTLTGNTTFAFTNTPNVSNTMYSFTLVIRQDSTGSRTATWPSIRWQAGITPTLTTTANKVDIVSLMTPDGGTTWFGSIAKNY